MREKLFIFQRRWNRRAQNDQCKIGKFSCFAFSSELARFLLTEIHALCKWLKYQSSKWLHYNQKMSAQFYSMEKKRIRNLEFIKMWKWKVENEHSWWNIQSEIKDFILMATICFITVILLLECLVLFLRCVVEFAVIDCSITLLHVPTRITSHLTSLMSILKCSAPIGSVLDIQSCKGMENLAKGWN